MTREDWRPIADLLIGAYGESRFTPQAIKTYFETLEDLKATGVLWSVKEMIRTQPAFPSVADIRRIYAAEKARRCPAKSEDDYPEGHPERERLAQERLGRAMRTYRL